jgi:hypothetical protein
MEKLSLRKNKGDLIINDNEIRDMLKSELEERRLVLRKNKINDFIFSKRKIANHIENIEENMKKYKIELNDINISEKYKIDVLAFHSNVRQ